MMITTTKPTPLTTARPTTDVIQSTAAVIQSASEALAKTQDTLVVSNQHVIDKYDISRYKLAQAGILATGILQVLVELKLERQVKQK